MIKEIQPESFCTYIEGHADRVLLDAVSERFERLNEQIKNNESVISHDVIAWRGSDAFSRELRANFDITDIGPLNKTAGHMHISRGAYQSEVGETAIIGLTNSKFFVDWGKVFIGEDENSYGFWFVSVCKALEDGVSPQTINDVARNLNKNYKIPKGLGKVEKSAAIYRNFIEELSKLRYYALN